MSEVTSFLTRSVVVCVIIKLFCTAFDMPQLRASEEWCVFIGHEYTLLDQTATHALLSMRFECYINSIPAH